MIKNFTLNEEILRTLYHKDLLDGKIQGPIPNYPEESEEYLKYYSREELMHEMPHKTMYQYLYDGNIDNMDLNAIYYFDKKVTYKEFFEKINKCANALINSGIKKGDVVSVCMPNTPEALYMFYALNKIGAVADMIHPLSSENEIKEFVNNANSKALLVINTSYQKVKNIKNDLCTDKIIVTSPADSMDLKTKKAYPIVQILDIVKKDETLKKLIAEKDAETNKLKKAVKSIKVFKKYLHLYKSTKKDIEKEYELIGNDISYNDFIKKASNNEVKPVDYDPNAYSVMLHTGGTETGKSKAVKLTNDNFNTMVEQFMNVATDFEKGDKLLAVMPVFHGFGLCSSIHLPLTHGVGTILIPKIDITTVDKLFDKYKPNHLLGVPTLYKGIMKTINAKIQSGELKDFDLSYLKYAVSGGDNSKEEFTRSVNDFFKEHGSNAKLAKGYGLTEAVAGATFAYADYSDGCGIPMTHTKIKIVDQKTGLSLCNGMEGEICIKGPSVMQGYYNNEEATNNKLPGDGWLHTGDIGKVEDGILYFVQRKSNMIISSGVNVYPTQIEQVIECHPLVQSCSVTKKDDEMKGEVPVAYIILKDGVELNDSIKKEIKDLCYKNLNRYSMPAEYEFVSTLPQTLLGKVNLKALRDFEKEKQRKLKKIV